MTSGMQKRKSMSEAAGEGPPAKLTRSEPAPAGKISQEAQAMLDQKLAKGEVRYSLAYATFNAGLSRTSQTGVPRRYHPFDHWRFLELFKDPTCCFNIDIYQIAYVQPVTSMRKYSAEWHVCA